MVTFPSRRSLAPSLQSSATTMFTSTSPHLPSRLGLVAALLACCGLACGQQCATFETIYGSGRALCENMWGGAFTYETNESAAYTMWFFDKVTTTSRCPLPIATTPPPPAAPLGPGPGRRVWSDSRSRSRRLMPPVALTPIPLLHRPTRMMRPARRCTTRRLTSATCSTYTRTPLGQSRTASPSATRGKRTLAATIQASTPRMSSVRPRALASARGPTPGLVSHALTMSLTRCLHHATDSNYGDEYRWDRCGPLSQACERFFVQEACFYECEPSAGLYRKCVKYPGPQRGSWPAI